MGVAVQGDSVVTEYRYAPFAENHSGTRSRK